MPSSLIAPIILDDPTVAKTEKDFLTVDTTGNASHGELKERALSGKGTIRLPLAGNPALAFNGADYTKMPSNQTIDRTVNCTKEYLLSHLKECAVLAPGDSTTQAHEFVAVGMVRKTTYNMIEIVTEVEWSPGMIRHKFRTSAVGGGGGCCPPNPSDCIVGYGGEITVNDIGNGKTHLLHTAYQEPALCHPCACCCCCQLFLWGKIGAMFLNNDINAIEVQFANRIEM